jgi:hypothetical protein
MSMPPLYASSGDVRGGLLRRRSRGVRYMSAELAWGRSTERLDTHIDGLVPDRRRRVRRGGLERRQSLRPGLGGAGLDRHEGHAGQVVELRPSAAGRATGPGAWKEEPRRCTK